MILKYLGIFLALLLFGNIADVPFMFLAVRGEISLPFVYIVGFLTDVGSDFFWYWLGGKIGVERFENMKFFKQNPERINFVSKALDKYGMFMLFSSKFIHSMGVPTQIVAGAHRYPKGKFLIANVLGAGSTATVIYLMAKAFNSVDLIERYLHNINVSLLIFFLSAIGLHFLISGPLKRMFSRQ